MSGWMSIQKWFRSQTGLALGVAFFILVLVNLVWVLISPILAVVVIVSKF